MANIKDFAVGLVLTAPSPATSGTSLVLRSGEGTTMPAVPFYATATPPGQLTTLGTSEKVLVTAVTGDTLTIVRAQGGTTAKSIAANWIFANAMYTDDVFQSSIVTDELMTGTVNGSNTVFTTTSAFSNIQVYKNGVAMHKTDDFTITGTNQITMVTAPATGTKLTATYIVGTSVMINGSNSTINGETPTGTVNGSNAVFTTSKPYIAGSLVVHINGIRQKGTTHFVETTPTTGTFTMGDSPLTGDDIMVSYQYVQSVSGNADTLDGEHLSTILSAIYPIGATFVSGSSTMPSLISSIGTWVRLNGRVIVGVDEGQAEFDTVNETGGAKTHTLTTAEMPSHNHAGLTAGGVAIGVTNGPSGSGKFSHSYSNTTNYDLDLVTALNGGGGSHNNLQPYKTKYMWERTA